MTENAANRPEITLGSPRVGRRSRRHGIAAIDADSAPLARVPPAVTHLLGDERSVEGAAPEVV